METVWNCLQMVVNGIFGTLKINTDWMVEWIPKVQGRGRVVIKCQEDKHLEFSGWKQAFPNSLKWVTFWKFSSIVPLFSVSDEPKILWHLLYVWADQ